MRTFAICTTRINGEELMKYIVVDLGLGGRILLKQGEMK
jgi:hypothetical protein